MVPHLVKYHTLRNTLQHTTTHCHTLLYTATHYNTLQHTATYYHTLPHTAIHCNTLQHTATHYHILPHTATHCYTLQHTTTHCHTLPHTTTHCHTLLYTATHYNTLQHTATYYHALPHTAIHCNTLQHTATHVSWSINGARLNILYQITYATDFCVFALIEYCGHGRWHWASDLEWVCFDVLETCERIFSDTMLALIFFIPIAAGAADGSGRAVPRSQIGMLTYI